MFVCGCFISVSTLRGVPNELGRGQDSRNKLVALGEAKLPLSATAAVFEVVPFLHFFSVSLLISLPPLVYPLPPTTHSPFVAPSVLPFMFIASCLFSSHLPVASFAHAADTTNVVL
jgi:hypothetical protein